MLVNRLELLGRLKAASIGLSDKVVLEQSDCFVFQNGRVSCFNDEVYASARGLHEKITAVVNASKLLQILSRLSEDELNVDFTPTEMLIKGKGKEAGIPSAAEVLLPIQTVPTPGKMQKVAKGVSEHLKQAARICGDDEIQAMTTCVQVTPKIIQACDNHRMYRAECETGFSEDVLIPATAIDRLSELSVVSACAKSGWLHLECADDVSVSIRCVVGDFPELAGLLEVKGKELKLPKGLEEAIGRASAMSDGGHGSRVIISIAKGIIQVESRQENVGWYRERRKTDFAGELCFSINPDFMLDVLKATRTVIVDGKRMKLKLEGVHIVLAVALPKE